ncbi:hypothetical protein C8F01DRAFT_1234727 [Mycena amicta]|nr:hypothetical protein C8F01DRAFT_1234727 [Mycena amicta]
MATPGGRPNPYAKDAEDLNETQSDPTRVKLSESQTRARVSEAAEDPHKSGTRWNAAAPCEVDGSKAAKTAGTCCTG